MYMGDKYIYTYLMHRRILKHLFCIYKQGRWDGGLIIFVYKQIGSSKKNYDQSELEVLNVETDKLTYKYNMCT